jgi:hypothetical protein
LGIAGQDKASWQTEDLPFEIVILLLEHVATNCDGLVDVDEREPLMQDHLLRVIDNFEPQNFDLLETNVVTSQSKIDLWKCLQERKHKANDKSRRKLSEETKGAFEMMLPAKDANGESAETGRKLPEEAKVAIEMVLATEDSNGESAENNTSPDETMMVIEIILAAEDANDRCSHCEKIAFARKVECRRRAIEAPGK